MIRHFLILFVCFEVSDLTLQAEEGGEPDDLDAQIDDKADSSELGDGKLDQLILRIDNERSYFRRSAIWEARLHSGSEALVAKLVGYVRDKEPEYASIAAASLGEMKAQAAVPALRKALAHKSDWIRESAAYALGRMLAKTAVDDLKRQRPEEPGLSQWIFDDAITRLTMTPQSTAPDPRSPTKATEYYDPSLSDPPAAPSPHRQSLEGASVYYFGAEGPTLQDSWRAIIKEYGIKVDGVTPPPLNVVMGYFGGPPPVARFYELLKDKDGKPQVDVVLVSGLLPYEFPPELRWNLFQFVRRGGKLIVLGNTMFVHGEIRTVTRSVVHYFASPRELWHDCLPDLDSEFRPVIAGFRGGFRDLLRSGVREFGHGLTLLLASSRQPKLPVSGLDQSETHEDHRDKNWGMGYLTPEHFRNLLVYAFEQEAGFPALVDLYKGPERIVAGDTAAFHVNLFSAAASSGTLDAEILFDKKPVLSKSVKVEMAGKRLQATSPAVDLPWTLQDGNYECRLTFRTEKAESSAAWRMAVSSPIRLSWELEDSYEEPGRTLTGSAEIENQRKEPVPDARLVLEVADHRFRALQRLQRPLTLNPGKNGPFPLRAYARDYRIGSYWLTLKVVQRDKTLQSSARLLHRCGPYRFQQDIVYVPWNTSAIPTEERMAKLMAESGFNGIGGQEAIPGWYNWGVDGPGVSCMPVWPGDLVLKTVGARNRTMVEFGQFLRHRLPGYTIVDPWDESPVAIVTSERGEDLGPTSSVMYRNWLKSRYFSLDALNEVWRKEYDNYAKSDKPATPTWAMPAKTRVPPRTPWQGDLTSWNQIWAWRGAPADWGHYADGLWGEIIFSECHSLFRKLDPNHWWHWADAFHTRLYTGARPGQLNWECHRSRAGWGNRPSTIMLHFCYVYPEKRPGPVRRFHWDGLAGGGRHFINWTPDLSAIHGLSPDVSIWKPDYTLKPHGKAIADSTWRVRAKEQVLLDGLNSLSREVAFLYNETADWPPGEATPRALFDALLFGGILPESLKTDALRSERMSLDSFRVIFVCGKRELPEPWHQRLAEWQKKGGTLLYAGDFKFDYRGDRIETPGFTEYQSRLLAKLREHGVVPPAQVLDDNGLPEPAIEPVLLETADRSQFYLLAACDWALDHSQAFGDLGRHEFARKIELKDGLEQGAGFRTDGERQRLQLWAEIQLQEPFKAKATVDGKPGDALVVYAEYASVLWAERGVGQSRWVAGPVFDLEPGDHVLKIERQAGQAKILRAWLVNESLLQPKLVCTMPGVREVYDVYNDRLLPRADDGWRMAFRASEGEVYGLITEDLGPVEVEPRLVPGDLDRRLQLKISIRRSDGSLSECRHAVNIQVRDAKGAAVDGLAHKASVRGWEVVSLYPAAEDPALPWTVEVKDLTSGRVGAARVAAASETPFDSLKPVPPVLLQAEPTPMLSGHVHFVPLRVTVTNHRNAPLTGELRLEAEQDILWDGKPEMSVEVAANGQSTFEWPLILGRKQAIQLMDRPPRGWLRLSDGKVLETQFDDVWILRWERQPPLLTNLESREVPIEIHNFLGKPVSGKLEMGFSDLWEVTEQPAGDLSVAGASSKDAAVGSVRFKARVKRSAAQAPEVYRMPLKLSSDGRSYELGQYLVEVEKRRQWYVAPPPPEIGGEFDPEIPTNPTDAAKSKLWDLDWKLHERDTLIDFDAPVGQRVLAVTNVCFAESGEVSARIRGQEKVDLWLAGSQLMTEKPKEDEAAEAVEQIAVRTIRVPAGKWLPLVLRYQRASAYPNTDLVFLDKDGKVIWTAEFRAAP